MGLNKKIPTNTPYNGWSKNRCLDKLPTTKSPKTVPAMGQGGLPNGPIPLIFTQDKFMRIIRLNLEGPVLSKTRSAKNS